MWTGQGGVVDVIAMASFVLGIALSLFLLWEVATLIRGAIHQKVREKMKSTCIWSSPFSAVGAEVEQTRIEARPSVFPHCEELIGHGLPPPGPVYRVNSDPPTVFSAESIAAGMKELGRLGASTPAPQETKEQPPPLRVVRFK